MANNEISETTVNTVDCPPYLEHDQPVSDRPVSIGIVAGEVSGDILGAGLIQSLKKRYPNATFEGIGGPLMIEQGFKTHVPMERLSVMGLVEVLGRLFELIGIRRRIKRYFLNKQPDVFIGIDAPDFNLGLEEKLRKNGIKTSHYVSPSVWAWRQKRVFKIARAVDLMLTLLPFEAKFYRSHNVAVRFVGHPLADSIPLRSEKLRHRESLGVSSEAEVVAILPGSRGGEVSYIGDSFIGAAEWVYARKPKVQFIIPCVNEERKTQIESLIAQRNDRLPIKLVLGKSREIMGASDVVLLASGTATLEAMLLKKPMVVAYRVSRITHYIMKRLLKAPFISLPNLLAGKALVPELIQDDAQPELIGKEIMIRLDKQAVSSIEGEFIELHSQLKRDASERAADAVMQLIEGQLNEKQSNDESEPHRSKDSTNA